MTKIPTKTKRPQCIQVAMGAGWPKGPFLNVMHADSSQELIKISKKAASILIANGMDHTG